MKEDPDLFRLIVDEVDEARETLELVEQMREGLPFKSFKDLRSACQEGTLEFRGRRYKVDQFEEHLPTFVFPIGDLETLVSRVAMFVKVVPDSIGYDDPRRAKRQLRQLGMLGLPNGWPNNAVLGSAGAQFGAAVSLGETRIKGEER